MTDNFRSLRFLSITLAALALALSLALAALLGDDANASSSNPVSESTAHTNGLPAPLPTVIQLPGCEPVWSIIPSANASGDNHLAAVDAISESDVWAVGHHQTCNQIGECILEPLAMHWDGIAWNVVPTPTWAPGHYAFLTGVAALATNDVWAVGYVDGPIRTVTLHWDGQSWHTVDSPNGGTHGSRLKGVAGIAANNVWAAGEYFDSDYHTHTLVERWDGAQWTVVPSPSPASSIAGLEAITVLSANDAWAVGSYYDESISEYRSLALHWDGSVWSLVPTPDVETRSNWLRSVAGSGTSDVWAVGSTGSVIGGKSVPNTLALRWDGQEWTIVPSPSPGSAESHLYGVTALSAEDVWAVGFSRNAGEGFVPSATLVEKWDGAAWHVVSSPNEGTSDNFLNAVAALPGNTVWTAGYSRGYTNPTLTMRYSEQVFADVQGANTFYPYIRSLACHGIISGYTCGGPGEPCDFAQLPYFRVGSQVTRGQLSKIVSNSAGFNEPHSEQSFEDIVTGSTFYDFIERLSFRGIIAGYPCGGPSEPCVTPGNRPYFRPNASVTRGQTAKIVASARGLPSPPSGQQTFEDVPVASTFWPWIEALSTSGAISGYPCGGPSEPCIAPGNRPYFRPGLNITRGQAAKIVANNFFPGNQIFRPTPFAPASKPEVKHRY